MAPRKIDLTKVAPPDIFALPVLPAADVFPMMERAEFAELVADIREFGLREPLVTAMVDDDLVLVDGRNRRAACQEAGVAPVVRQLDGEDPTAFVLSANIHRRHMTRGQRAMAVAMIYPDPATLKRAGTSSVIITELGGSLSYISHARTVLRFTPEAVPIVMSGAVSLDDAYQEAKRLRERSELESTKLEEAATKLARRMEALRERDEGLHDKVVDGEMTIKEAEEEAKRREKMVEQDFSDLAKEFTEAAHRTNQFSYPAADQLLEFLAKPERRRQLRDRAYKFGCIVVKERSLAGMERMAEIFDLLHETEASDGEGDRND